MLKFNVKYSSWSADGEEFAGGEHEIENPSAELVKLAGSANAAGAIEVTEGLDESHVESQEDSEAKLVEAMGSWVAPALKADGSFEPGYWDGPWQEGHSAQASADAAGGNYAEVAVDVEPASEEA